MAFRFLPAAIAAVWIAFWMPVEAATRLAVVAPPDCAKEASLLTAALSSRDDLEVLERDEINKVAAERNLQAINPENGLKLGGLLKADGLVLLEPGSQELTMRVLDVDSGALVRFFSSPLPVSSPESWSKLRADEIAKVAAKLAEPMSKLTPISLLRINSAQGGAQGRSLEESLNRILAERLSASPDLVILERSKLQEAVGEKGLAAESGPFWNSAWVLDGSVTPEAGGYTARFRLQPPGSEAASLVDVEGPDLSALVEQANVRILAALRRPMRPWDAATESSRFVEEAKWAASNRLWDQAAGAIEAAIALGDKQPDILEWRWKCYDLVSRNVSAPALPGAAKAEKKAEPPTVSQISAKARSVNLCRESLAGAGKTASARFRFYPRSLEVQDRFGKGPVAEACCLLESSGGLLLPFAEKPELADGPRLEALAELRSEMRGLFDEIVRLSPSLQLRPRSDSVVPAWDPQGDTRYRNWIGSRGPREKEKVLFHNVHMLRLSSGRLWEESAEPYFAYVRQCLSSDLPEDPYFFPLVLDLITRQSRSAAFMPRDPEGPKWREEGKALAKEKNASLRVGAAVVLVSTGLPREGLQVYEKEREAVLNGRWPLIYLLSPADPYTPVDDIARRFGDASFREFTLEVLKFATGLMGEGFVPSREELECLTRFQLSERQSEALLETLQKPPPGVLASSSVEQWNETAEFAIRSLSERVRKPAVPLPPVEPPHPPSPAQSPAAPAGSAAINVDLAWAAKDPAYPSAPGKIRWLVPMGRKVWLMVEYEAKHDLKRERSARRQIMTVDLPSMKSRTIYRDEPVFVAGRPFPRGGPVFATDGEAVYFWNGKGISCFRDGSITTLQGPDLVEPLFWLVDGQLFVADRLGLLLRYESPQSMPEILASQRRRPAQNELDAQPGLENVERIFKSSDGVLTIKIGPRELCLRDGKWIPSPMVFRFNDEQQVIRELENATEENVNFVDRRLSSLLELRARKQNGGARPRGNPVARYLPPGTDPNHRVPRHAWIRSSFVKDGALWCLLEDSKVMILRVNLADDQFVCRPLDFSPEFLASIENPAGSALHLQIRPVEDGAILFTLGEPLLWFLPADQVTAVNP